MPAKKKVCFFLVMLLLPGLMCTVDAVGASSDITVTFHGAGVTIDLKYPEESLPGKSIWHNVTITADIGLTLRNFTVVIKALENSTWQVIFADKLPANYFLQANTPFEWLIQTDQLPEETNGKLSCFMNVSTSQSTDYATYTFYTTHVSDPTFSEMQSLYYEMLANYTILQANYTSLLNDYNGLLANYNTLFANYTALLSEYDTLSAQYDAKVSSYQTLLDKYNNLLSDNAALNDNYKAKIAELGDLQADFDELNETRYSLQGNYTSLQADYDALNQTYTGLLADLNSLQALVTRRENELNSERVVMVIFVVAVAALVAFIVYIRWKKQEPYVVIRKETVSVNPDEKSEAPG